MGDKVLCMSSVYGETNPVRKVIKRVENWFLGEEAG